MRFLAAICFAMLALGCSDGRSLLPTGPSSLPTTALPGLPGPTNAITIVAVEVVNDRVRSDDPLCDPEWPHRCRYYQLKAAVDGVLDVSLKWSSHQLDPYPLDIDVIGVHGRIGPTPAIGPGNQRRVSLPVRAGDTYAIEIWSFLSPGEVFDLSATIRTTSP